MSKVATGHGIEPADGNVFDDCASGRRIPAHDCRPVLQGVQVTRTPSVLRGCPGVRPALLRAVAMALPARCNGRGDCVTMSRGFGWGGRVR